MSRRVPVIGAAGAILLWSGTAHAHLVTTGVGPVYDGISHLFVTFDDLLAALVAAGVISLRHSWARIAVRVAGRWIAAIGLLLLGWALSGRG